MSGISCEDDPLLPKARCNPLIDGIPIEEGNIVWRGTRKKLLKPLLCCCLTLEAFLRFIGSSRCHHSPDARRPIPTNLEQRCPAIGIQHVISIGIAAFGHEIVRCADDHKPLGVSETLESDVTFLSDNTARTIGTDQKPSSDTRLVALRNDENGLYMIGMLLDTDDARRSSNVNVSIFFQTVVYNT